MRLLLARHPDRLSARHPLIIEEFLELVYEGKVEAVHAMITMLSDLHVHGRNSRYLRNLAGTPLWELKTQSRGGVKGGSRVYLFVTQYDEAGIVNCEVKDEDGASMQKLKLVLQVLRAYTAGEPVF
jgi:hypothetical protein